jgi:hypothetical protein
MLSLTHLKGLVKGSSSSKALPAPHRAPSRAMTRPTKPKNFSRSCSATAEPEQGERKRKGSEEASTNVGNIYRLTPQDQFDWGSIKDRVFGTFGQRPPSEPIRRLSFVPDPTPDETIVPKYASDHH